MVYIESPALQGLSMFVNQLMLLIQDVLIALVKIDVIYKDGWSCSGIKLQLYNLG